MGESREPDHFDDIAEELDEIRDEVKDLMRKARSLLRGTSEYGAADAYWLAHIETALGGGRYRTYSTTMRDSINGLRGHDPEEADD